MNKLIHATVLVSVIILFIQKSNDIFFMKVQLVSSFVSIAAAPCKKRNRLIDTRRPTPTKRRRNIKLQASNKNIPPPTSNVKTRTSYINIDYGCVSIPGTDPDRPQKINQDGSFYVPPYYTSTSDSHHNPIVDQSYRVTIFGVMDGHGKKGHETVKYLQEQVPIRVQEYLSEIFNERHGTNVYENAQTTTTTMKTNVNGIKKDASNIYPEEFCLDEQKLELISLGNANPIELHYNVDNNCDNANNNVEFSMANDMRIEQAIINAFIQIQHDLRRNPNVPSSRSGTTCICCVLVEVCNDEESSHSNNQLHQIVLYTANIGDSRALLISRNTNTTDNSTISLTQATTVEILSERKRIEKCSEFSRIDSDGNVFYGPVGIAMTRSLGNSVMLRAGILPIPIITKEIIQLNNTSATQYYICAGTDGIFDVLSNEHVANQIFAHQQQVKSLNDTSASICQQAKLAWLADLPVETKVDDCTIAILKLSNC